jgi:uncharacterized membrane protein (DUF2068 family)
MSESPRVSPAQAAPDANLPVRLSRGLHIVAFFEATKGVLVLAAGVGALSLLNRDASRIAENIVRQLQLNPASHYPRIFVQLASQVTNTQLWIVSMLAIFYSAMRFAEAYGLWKNRGWAEWLAVLGGMFYLPFEIAALIKHSTAIKFGLLALNLVVVIYVARVLWIKRRALALARTPA